MEAALVPVRRRIIQFPEAVVQGAERGEGVVHLQLGLQLERFAHLRGEQGHLPLAEDLLFGHG